MSFFSRLKSSATSLVQSALENVNRLMDKNLIQATGAALARVVLADGKVVQEEEEAVVTAIQNNDKLKNYAGEIIDAFQAYLETLKKSSTMGKIKANQAIQKIQKNSDQAMLLMAACCDIGASDGDFDNDEKAVVREMCGLVGVDPKNIGL